MGEVGAVDDDEGVRARGDDRIGGLTDARDQLRQARDDRQYAHHRDVADRKQARQPFGRHRFAADPGEGDAIRPRLAERPHEPGAYESPECSPATSAIRNGLTP